MLRGEHETHPTTIRGIVHAEMYFKIFTNSKLKTRDQGVVSWVFGFLQTVKHIGLSCTSMLGEN